MMSLFTISPPGESDFTGACRCQKVSIVLYTCILFHIRYVS